jgi:hypothetical protein
MSIFWVVDNFFDKFSSFAFLALLGKNMNSPGRSFVLKGTYAPIFKRQARKK